MDLVKAICIHETGGPEVLRWEEASVGEPGVGEVRLRHHAIGLNYIDVYIRTGLYPVGTLPFVPGMEGAGEITALGEGVTGFSVGDRVAYGDAIGAYAEERLISADRIVKLPSAISYETAAAMMLKGMTARYLLRKTFQVTSDTTLLFHAAAGGVGQIACQWARELGAIIIGTVGSEEKADLARAHGCHHTINYRNEDFVARTKELTDGEGVDVVYDSIGQATFPGSLDCLKPFGLWVSFGQASGPLPEFNMGLLAQKGSLFATRPSLFTYIEKRADLEETANDLFAMVGSGKVSIPVNQTYNLQDAKTAHIELEARKTTGSSVLLPAG